MQKIIKRLLITGLLSFIIFFTAIISILWIYSNKLPDYKYLKNYKPPVSSKLYSGDGVLVSDFSSEKRIFVPYSAISKTVINAFLSAEDKIFHGGEEVQLPEIPRLIELGSKDRNKPVVIQTDQWADATLLAKIIAEARKIAPSVSIATRKP